MLVEATKQQYARTQCLIGLLTVNVMVELYVKWGVRIAYLKGSQILTHHKRCLGYLNLS